MKEKKFEEWRLILLVQYIISQYEAFKYEATETEVYGLVASENCEIFTNWA